MEAGCLGYLLEGQKRTDSYHLTAFTQEGNLALWLELSSSDFKAFAGKQNSAGPGLVPTGLSLSKWASVSSKSPVFVMQSLCAEGMLANVGPLGSCQCL